jgi:heptosyltransferase-2
MSTQTSNPWNLPLRAAAEQKPVRRTLCVGVNWIGDTIMSMPAIEAWRKTQRDAHLGLLVKKNLAPLWELHSAPDNILTFDDTSAGTFAAGKSLRSGRFERAVILPNSFRAALIPFLARVPERIGTPSQFRSLLLTRKIAVNDAIKNGHQALEYFGLFGIEAPEKIEPPTLKISEGAREYAMAKLESLPRPLVGLIPGAARGPSKRWPAGHFAEVGRALANDRKCGIVLFGGGDDVELCEQIREQIGGSCISLAGRTSLKEWAALLACCQLVVCNDSGGMHIAAAVGTPLIAVFGLTDPAKTGPLGKNCIVLQDEAAGRSRDIARDSEEACKRLAAISSGRVCEAADQLLAVQTV